MVVPQLSEEDMTKHILDHGRLRNDSPLDKALAAERLQGPQRPTLKLQRRSRLRKQGLRSAMLLRAARMAEAHS